MVGKYQGKKQVEDLGIDWSRGTTWQLRGLRPRQALRWRN